LSFTAEDVWRCMPGAGRPDSVLLAGLAPPPVAWRAPDVAARFERLLTVRGAVSKAIEEARQAGLVKQSSEARVALGAPSADGLGTLLAEQAADLPSLFLVAEVARGAARRPPAALLRGDARGGGRARLARAAHASRPARAGGRARRRPGRRPRQPRLPPPLRRSDRLPRPPLGRAPLARLQRRRLGDHGGRRRDLATRAEEPRLLGG